MGRIPVLYVGTYFFFVGCCNEHTAAAVARWIFEGAPSGISEGSEALRGTEAVPHTDFEGFVNYTGD